MSNLGNKYKAKLNGSHDYTEFVILHDYNNNQRVLVNLDWYYEKGWFLGHGLFIMLYAKPNGKLSKEETKRLSNLYSERNKK